MILRFYRHFTAVSPSFFSVFSFYLVFCVYTHLDQKASGQPGRRKWDQLGRRKRSKILFLEFWGADNLTGAKEKVNLVILAKDNMRYTFDFKLKPSRETYSRVLEKVLKTSKINYSVKLWGILLYVKKQCQLQIINILMTA